MEYKITKKDVNGKIETVIVDRFCLTPLAFECMKKATKAVRRGELLKYEEVKQELTQAEAGLIAVNKLFAGAEAAKDDPGRYFTKLKKAEKAMNDWKEKYPAEAKERDKERDNDLSCLEFCLIGEGASSVECFLSKDKERDKEEQRRKENLESSFIGKSID